MTDHPRPRTQPRASSQDEDDSPFHAGERALQAALGLRARAEQLGQFMIRDEMPEQHREFFAQLPFVLVGSLDDRSRPWASLLVGEPGFVHSPDTQHLDVHAEPWPGDPLSRSLEPGVALGLLGIQLETRRRNRMNGRVVSSSARGFSLRVDQSFGNCPKYITARTPLATPRARSAPEREGAALSAAARACIAACDTCFIASASAPEVDLADPREGVDVSHRGGKPGFMAHREEHGVSTLLLPDFAGNNMFNTLGNLSRYPRAGLLFLDFERGNTLQVTCTTELIASGPQVAQFQGAQRLTRLRVEEGLFYRGALPFRWSSAEPSPQHARMGSWSEALDEHSKP